ncbi:hypothetical protein [Devosia aurantiaca]|uniref:Tail assembly chaperone n=1 Tax=Devosia aurantiaca TaxID=2714858 RepID=A0A6M1SX93_9HYPH|nr:hypothetical protein [Devosia aurantiaca]NGP18923.1 hypothetical protein [Devosia aurantiaca]
MNTENTVLELSSDDFASADTATMNVMVGGKPSGWLWEFAGPSHPKTLNQANRTARETLHKTRLIEQAQVNGRKWIAEEQTPDQVRAGNVDYVIERLLGWSAIRIDGADVPFTDAKAREMLANPKNVSLLAQAMEFLAADSSFTKRSA